MNTRLVTNGSIEEFKFRIVSLMEVECRDDLLTHFRQAILFENSRKISGVVEGNRFKIWIHEPERLGATGVFYPVVTGKLFLVNNGLEVELGARMNVIGIVIFIIIATGLMYGILTGIILREDNALRYLLTRAIAGLVLFGMMISVPSFIYFRTKRIVTQYLVPS